MTEVVGVAQGIHAHDTKKLGRRKPDPAHAEKSIKFGEHLKTVPEHPVSDEDTSGISYPMDLNDKYGDCVVAGLDHTLQTICALLGVQRTNWTDQQIIAYYKTQNPDFDPNSDAGDNGMDIQTFLEYLVKQKIIVAFAKVDHNNADEMKAADYLGLAVVTGEMLEVAQQSQQLWDYVPNSGDWGGHCTCTVGYRGTPDNKTLVTWGQELDYTESFETHNVEEAWFVLTEELISHPTFRQNYDLNSFAAAYTSLTGSPFPVVVPPDPAPPSPDPVPTPGPDYPPAPSPSPGGSLRQWLSAVLHWAYTVWHIFRRQPQ